MLKYRFALATALIAVGAIGLALAPQTSLGAIVEIAVSGRITVNDSLTLLPDEIQTGEPWSGLIRYHTDLPDEDPDPKRAYYFDTSRPNGLSISVNVHGFEFAGGFGDLQAEVLNDIVHDPDQVFNPPPGDSFSIGGPMQLSPRLLDQSSIFFSWNDSSGEALSGEALPTDFDPFAFQQLDTAIGRETFSPIYVVIQDFGLSTPSVSSSYIVVASIESAVVTVVPEPSTISFLIVCISGLRMVWHIGKPSGTRVSFAQSLTN